MFYTVIEPESHRWEVKTLWDETRVIEENPQVWPGSRKPQGHEPTPTVETQTREA